MNQTVTAEICVVGAGPVGGTLACTLADAGIATVVVDRAPLPPMEHPAFDGRAYAIAAGSRELLDQAGLWAGLPEPPCPILDIRVSDGRVGRAASPRFLHFAHHEAGADAGPFGWMVEARSLRRALNTHMAALPMLSVCAPAEAAAKRSAAGAMVRIAGGPEMHCRLIVAAEGRGSPLRDAAGIPVTRLHYRQTSIVTAISHERPHHNTALEHFLPTGPFAQLPMGASADAEAGGAPNVSAIVWTERSDIAERMLALDDARFGREIARRLGDHLGRVRPIGRRWSYPLSAMLAHRYTDVRLALVGDAAHGIHPIAGQGLNLGFRDAIALADLLIEAHRSGADPGSPALLARYQRRRRGDNLAMLAMTDGLDRLFSNDSRLLRAARDLGIAAVHRTPPLKRLFMRQAMGLGMLPGAG
ncbi:MAG TPA: UbiH/UbiF/VisC/COQ6 family ubiquinone biosynthesis hydroxylase [Acetobacteraceae bacterium]|nr:UbiH/UbiF/VisC/COQ6 family ubiquinone biosynthesis hydroxylase [Acetobacteraceae bacterium]